MANIYSDIATRTQGDIYIGVVGPVRTGKSTFIKKFMDELVLPNMDNEYKKERSIDELPQSGAGKTIMTTEPKFVPNEAVKVSLDDNANFNVRLIDCVGYIVPGAQGYIENNAPRMVRTPWFDEEVPFDMAAETGTKKVINDHSTIGLVVTCDGTITDIDREDYEEAENRVINELKDINKPFAILLNSAAPNSKEAENLKEKLEKTYNAPVVLVDVMAMSEPDIRKILETVLMEFSVKEVNFDMPGWINSLPDNHNLKASLYDSIMNAAKNVNKIRDMNGIVDNMMENEYIKTAKIVNTELGTGQSNIGLEVEDGLFYQVLAEATGLEISDDEDLSNTLMTLAMQKKRLDKITEALNEVEEKGYGIVTPDIDELTLEEPEIVKQGGRYGIRLRASAPSLHLIKANIETEVSPIVGNEKQSEELVKFMLSEFEENPQKIWESNIFGKSVHELVNEGLHNKLNRMPDDARGKLQNTLERIINEGGGGLICIIL